MAKVCDIIKSLRIKDPLKVQDRRMGVKENEKCTEVSESAFQRIFKKLQLVRCADSQRTQLLKATIKILFSSNPSV